MKGNCTSSITITQWVENCVGIKENYADHNFIHYPNPFKESIHVHSDIETVLSVRDKFGTVQNLTVKTGENTFDTSSLPSALYFYSVDPQHASISFKLLRD